MKSVKQTKKLNEFLDTHELIDWFICPNEHPEVEFVDHVRGLITISGKKHEFMMSHEKEWFVAK